VLSFEAFLEEGMVDADELALFEFADSPEAVWDVVVRRGLKMGESA
jgi:hypothetical protein